MNRMLHVDIPMLCSGREIAVYLSGCSSERSFLSQTAADWVLRYAIEGNWRSRGAGIDGDSYSQLDEFDCNSKAMRIQFWSRLKRTWNGKHGPTVTQDKAEMTQRQSVRPYLQVTHSESFISASSCPFNVSLRPLMVVLRTLLGL